MINQIYFDLEQLAKGQTFQFQEPLTTEDGRTYELGDWIARGGNGSVFRCTERSTGDEYAVKFLMQSGGRISQRFFKEARLLKELKHEHIVQYRGTGRTKAASVSGKRFPFIVMEVADRNLSEAASSPLTPEIYVGQFRGLARGLADLHKKAIHRDIKPENILISGDRWLLSDYGLCRYSDRPDLDLTPTDQAIGPKYWLSPEAHNRRLGHPTQFVLHRMYTSSQLSSGLLQLGDIRPAFSLAMTGLDLTGFSRHLYRLFNINCLGGRLTDRNSWRRSRPP